MTTTTRYYALMPNGYTDTRDDYAPCETMGEACEILNEAHIYMSDHTLHVYDAGREPWNEVDPYPNHIVTLDVDGLPVVEPV